MEPTARSGDSGPSQAEFDFCNGKERVRKPNEVQLDLSADPNTLVVVPTKPVGDRVAEPVLPIWLQRVSLVVYVSFCIELGLWLIIVPWRQVWTANSLVASFPALHAVCENYFIRGLITGLGIIDVWLGISEAVRYREKKPS